MYDFWFSLGVATVQPNFVDAFAGHAAFDFVQRTIVETDNTGKQIILPINPSAGVLRNNATTQVRVDIANYLQTFSQRNFGVPAPPVSIYCAGRFCQLVKIPAFQSTLPNSSFRDIVALANTAYKKAVGAGKPSKMQSFLAFLGLCLLDNNLVADLILPQPTQKVLDAAAEFGISPGGTPYEWGLAKAFVQTQEFGDATQLLMVGDANPWKSHATEEQAYFWDGFSEHAVQ